MFDKSFCHRSKVSCEDGFAAGSGKLSSKTTFARPTLKAWERGTRWCSACWKPKPNTSSNSTSWSTTSCGHSEWPPAPRNRPSPTMMSAASSLTGGWWSCCLWEWCDSAWRELPTFLDSRRRNNSSWLPFCLFVSLVRPSCSSIRSSTRAWRPG